MWQGNDEQESAERKRKSVCGGWLCNEILLAEKKCEVASSKTTKKTNIPFHTYTQPHTHIYIHTYLHRQQQRVSARVSVSAEFIAAVTRWAGNLGPIFKYVYGVCLNKLDHVKAIFHSKFRFLGILNYNIKKKTVCKSCSTVNVFNCEVVFLKCYVSF